MCYTLVIKMKRGTGRVVDFSYVDKKKGNKRRRYYIYIETPELFESEEFPFTQEDKLFIQIEDGKLIIEKM